MDFFSSFLFPEPDFEQQVKQCNRQLRRDIREIRRDLRRLSKQEQSLTKNMARQMKKGYHQSVHQLARVIARARQDKKQISSMIQRLQSAQAELKTISAKLKAATCIESKTKLMKEMNGLLSLDKINKDMKELSKKMETATLLTDIVQETVDTGATEDADALEEAAQQIIEEVTNSLAESPTSQHKVNAVTSTNPGAAVEEEEAVSTADSASSYTVQPKEREAVLLSG